MQTITNKPPEQKTGKILIIAEIIPPTAEGTPTYVKLTIKPAGEEITLAAFDLKLWIKTAKGNVKTGGAIAMDKDLAKLDWTFPIKRVKTEGEQLVAEISGLHIAQKAFELPDEQILAMIPIIIPTGEKITVEFDNQVTQFLDSKSLKLITAHEQK